MDNYDDIINLPHHVSSVHPQMPVKDRAAQFSSFDALTGFSRKISETARLTDKKIELNEDQKSLIDFELKKILNCIDLTPEIEVTYFIPDKLKSGGRYETVSQKIKRIDTMNSKLIFENGTEINIYDILEIEMK